MLDSRISRGGYAHTHFRIHHNWHSLCVLRILMLMQLSWKNKLNLARWRNPCWALKGTIHHHGFGQIPFPLLIIIDSSLQPDPTLLEILVEATVESEVESDVLWSSSLGTWGNMISYNYNASQFTTYNPTRKLNTPHLGGNFFPIPALLWAKSHLAPHNTDNRASIQALIMIQKKYNYFCRIGIL